MSSVINTAIFRAYGAGEWEQMSSADLAAAISAPYSLRKMELVEFFGAISQAGAVTDEVAEFYKVQRFVDDLEYQLRNPQGQANTGNYAAMGMLVSVAQSLTTLTAPTLGAISAVMAATTQRLVDVVAAELGEEAPETVTAGDVDEALGRE